MSARRGIPARFGQEEEMQSQFTDRAREALNLAAKCARSLKQGYVGTEHILVGLLKEPGGVAHSGYCSGSGHDSGTDRV